MPEPSGGGLLKITIVSHIYKRLGLALVGMATL